MSLAASLPTTLRARDMVLRFFTTVENRSMVWSLADQFLVSAGNFALGIIAARLLGVSEFGQFTLILMLAALAGVFVEYIICAPMMTLAGRRNRRSDSYFGSVALLGLLLGMLGGVAVAAVLAGIFTYRDGTVSALLLAATFVATFGQIAHGAARRVLFARRRNLAGLSIDVARFVLLGAVVLALYLTGTTLSAETFLLMLGATALAAALPSLAQILSVRLSRRLLVHVFARHWPIARWLVLMVVVSIGQEQIVWVIVSVSLGDAAVGGLRAGQYLLGITHFIMLALENFIPRNASDAYRTGQAAGLKRFLTRQTLLLGLPTFALLLFVAIPARFWLGTLFGPDYVAYAPILWVWAAAYAVIFVREMWVYYLRTIEQTRGTFSAFALSSAVSVALIYPAILAFGVIGAAIVVLIAHIVSMAYVLALVARHYRANVAGAVAAELTNA